MLFFGGGNNLLGGGEKERVIRVLRSLAGQPDRPSREEIEAYMRASGETQGDGAARVEKWYDGRDVLAARGGPGH